MTTLEVPAQKTGIGSRLRSFLALHGKGLLAAMVVAGATVALYLAMADEQGRLIYRAVSGESPRIRSEMLEGLHARLFALRGLAREWENHPPDEARFRAGADSLLRLDLQLRGIQWLDPSLAIRGSMPTGARLLGAPLDSSGDAIRIDELRALLTDADPTVSRSFPLPEEPRQILLCAPLHDGERLTGYLMGVARATDVIDALVRDVVKRGYSVQVTEGVFQVYGPVWLEGGEESTFGNESELKVGDLDWKVMVWPSTDLLGGLRSPLLYVMLGFGILLAIAIGVMIDRDERRKRRTAESETSGSVPSGKPAHPESAASSEDPTATAT
jgi:sensor domain CHASE-containing protein